MSRPPNPRKRRSDAVSATPPTSSKGRKRQKHTVNLQSSSGAREKGQQTLTQIQFVPRPPDADLTYDEDDLDLIREKPKMTGKRVSRRSTLEQKSTITQMDYLARPPTDLVYQDNELKSDLIEEQQAFKTVDFNRAEESAEKKVKLASPPLGSLGPNRLKSVPRRSSTVQSKASKKKQDPWDVSSSQPEVHKSLSLTKKSIRITSPKSTRPAKAAAVRKLRSLHVETQENVVQQKSEDKKDFNSPLGDRSPRTPQKLSRGRFNDLNKVIPSSQSPESVSPSSQKDRRSPQRNTLGHAQRNPLATRSMNVPPSAPTESASPKSRFTKMLKKIDGERNERFASASRKSPCESPNESPHKTLVVRFQVRWPPRTVLKPDTEGFTGHGISNGQAKTDSVPNEPQDNASLPALRKQSSKLLVDGWPDLEELLGRPTARSEATRELTKSAEIRYAGLDGTHEQETEYTVGPETQLAFADIQPSARSQIDLVPERDSNEISEDKADDVGGNEVEDDALSLGSPVIEKIPEGLGYAPFFHDIIRRQDKNIQYPKLQEEPDSTRKCPVKSPPTSTATQSSSRSSIYKVSLPRTHSSDLPSLRHQSQISTQYTEQPQNSTYPSSSHHRRSSPPHHVLTIKDSDSSLPLHEIPPHYLQDSDDEAPFDGDLDPTPRGLRHGLSPVEEDLPTVDLDFSPQGSSSPSLPPQPMNRKDQVRAGVEKKNLRKHMIPSSSPILKNGIKYLRESLLESLPGPPPLGVGDETENEEAAFEDLV